MPYRALTEVLLGHAPPAKAGDIVPETYLDMDGVEQPVDFDRLLELEAVEKVTARKAKAADGED